MIALFGRLASNSSLSLTSPDDLINN